MNLSLERRQNVYDVFQFLPLRIGRGITFKLWAMLELDAEEVALVDKYRLMESIVFPGSDWIDFKKALKSSLMFWIIILLPLWILGSNFYAVLSKAFFEFFLKLFFQFGWAPNQGLIQNSITIVALALFIGVPLIYYFALREKVKVRHLVSGGKMFRCDSVVELIHKEAELESRCQYLRQLLESAKHWDEREIIPIQPLDKINAKLAVLKALT